MKKTEQLTSNMSIIKDFDQPLTKADDILKLLNSILDDNCSIVKFQNSKNVFLYENGTQKEYFIIASVTYLGHPHPHFKKRMQLKEWYKDFYEEYKNKENSNIRILGLYHYDSMATFIEFQLENYIHKKLNSSSAHVYINDIYQGLKHGIFHKIDSRNNNITVIPQRMFKNYILGVEQKNEIFEFFETFNNSFKFNDWLPADASILEMKNGNWYQWKGTEWAGWYLEYKFSEFINSKDENIVVYIGNQKTSDHLDFDLFFPKENFYGDLKASDIDKKEAPANDQDTVLETISKNEKIWYVIYEHETIKDSTRNNEMAIKRMNLINTPYVEGEKISYASRMKHSVKFRKMQIFELNRVNMNETLSAFNQGKQPSGAARKAKFSIKKNNIDNFIIYSYEI